MGTSRNDPSPRRPPWPAAYGLIGRPEVPAREQHLAIWRAALGDREQKLRSELASAPLAAACRIAAARGDLAQSLEAYEHEVHRSKSASLWLELGRRALAKTVLTGGADREFAGELFAQVTGYYASRDLPSYVGARERVANVRESLALKEQLAGISREVAREGPPLDAQTTAGWRRYVAVVLERLTTRGAA